MHCSKTGPFGGTHNAFLSTVTACANSYILILFLTHCRLPENVCCPWATVSEREQCWETCYRQLVCIGLLSQLYCDFFMKLEYYISLSSSVFNSLCKMEFCSLTVTSNLYIEDLQYILLCSEAVTLEIQFNDHSNAQGREIPTVIFVHYFFSLLFPTIVCLSTSTQPITVAIYSKGLQKTFSLRMLLGLGL